MKRLLIISPYFPPSNAADMQRVRMSLPYYRQFGWDAEVVIADQVHSEMMKDPLLVESIPAGTRIHSVGALSKKWTGKFGLGSLALRSFFYYRKYVDRLLKIESFDLIFFSTTQFPITVLGRHWKKKFGVPYVIDMQDPWHSDYYRDKPAAQRPRKYWFSYRLNKYLEPLAMKDAGGLMSVSAAYLDVLHGRYPALRDRPSTVITFGSFATDFEIAARHAHELQPAFNREEGRIHLVYVGRGGYDLQPALRLLFSAFKKGLEEAPALFGKLYFHFIGTSYAPAALAEQTVIPLAAEMGLTAYVEEQTGRIGFFRGLNALKQSDALVVPGSDDPKYTASKLFPYLLAGKPLLAIFDPQSSTSGIIRSAGAGQVADLTREQPAIAVIFKFLSSLANGTLTAPLTDPAVIKHYSAEEMTRKECELFNQVISNERAH